MPNGANPAGSEVSVIHIHFIARIVGGDGIFFGHGRAAAALRLSRAELAIFRQGTQKNVLRGY